MKDPFYMLAVAIIATAAIGIAVTFARADAAFDAMTPAEQQKVRAANKKIMCELNKKDGIELYTLALEGCSRAPNAKEIANCRKLIQLDLNKEKKIRC